ncbi:MAG: CmcJ/NvfI family oxidoreductase [Reyranellaceae bacterium]
MSLALDARPTTIPKNLTATLHYLKRGAEKPTRYVDEPPPGVPAWNGIDDPHDIAIADARGRENEFTVDRNGFALVRSPSLVLDFYSDDEVRKVYYPEVEHLLRSTLGASRVFVFDHTVRNAGRKGAREPARRVHNDHTVNSAPHRAACVTISAPTRPRCSKAALASSMCGGRSVARCRTRRWRCAMPAPSPTTT